jgi:hypothetical protein
VNDKRIESQMSWGPDSSSAANAPGEEGNLDREEGVPLLPHLLHCLCVLLCGFAFFYKFLSKMIKSFHFIFLVLFSAQIVIFIIIVALSYPWEYVL